MTESLLALLSIFVGIAGSNLMGRIKNKYSFGLVGNTLAGVFGSIFFVKVLGQIGINPMLIVNDGNIQWPLFVLNLLLAFCGGVLSIVFLTNLERKISESSNNNMNSISVFKIVSFLEGLSYILLIFIAVPYKYIAGDAFLVKSLGMPHGILFVLYILMALFIKSKMKWNSTNMFYVLVASLLPFGTFYINKKYF